MWEDNSPMVETLQMDLTGMMCVTSSPISRISATIEYMYPSGLRRLTVECDNSSSNSGWSAYNTQLPVLELEAMTHTALERWQERHIKRALSGYRPWKLDRLMRSLLAELIAATSDSTPWKRLFR